MVIGILGGTGCVGRTLVNHLVRGRDYSVKASYYSSEPDEKDRDRVIWHRVNLEDSEDAARFMEDVDVLVYLVHSLQEETFSRKDRRMAEIAGRAAREAGVKQIIYLGGIISSDQDLSRHLSSRAETGMALASHGVPVAELRASIILAQCSVSTKLIYRLAKKLPVMVTPGWLNSCCAPIGIDDVTAAITRLVERSVDGHEIYEIGSDVMRYRELVSLTGEVLYGRRNLIITLPVGFYGQSSRIISALTGVDKNTVHALVQSLKNDTDYHDNRFEELVGREPVPVRDVLRSLSDELY